MWLYTIIALVCVINSAHLAEKPSDPVNSETSSNNEADAADDSDDYWPAMFWSDTFDWQLLKTISNEHEKNVLISPLSLKLALVVLYEGSEGLTKKQFQSVMQYSDKKEEIREKYKNLLTNLEKDKENYVINIGTRLFLESTIPPLQSYSANIKTWYNTIIQSTNFSNPKQTGEIINSWVDKLTDGHIKELINEDEVKDDSLLVVANAVYFKGKWRRKFPVENTYTGGFYVSPSKVVNVDYMSNTDTYYYGESKELDAKLLRLPYKGKNFGFFIILPNSKGGLSELISNANLHTMRNNLFLMEERKVDVVIPKFKFDFSASYTKILQDFGLTAMFSNTASFAGIARGIGSGTKWLFVNDLKQKSGIEFNEEGSTAFAATEIQLGNKFGESDVIFNASHPFLFFIEHQSTGTILFSGKIVNPLEGDHVDLPSRLGDTGDEKSSTASQDSNAQYSNLYSLDPLQSGYSDSITSRFNNFDLELLQFFDDKQNYFISPASIKATLGMILEGARGSCAAEISSILRIPLDQTSNRQLLSNILYNLNSKPGTTTVESANGAFISNAYELVPEYRRNLVTYYKADVGSVNFANSDYAARFINEWVFNRTRGLITDVITPENFNSDATLVIINALYFQGKWKNEFDLNSTNIKCFYEKSECVPTKMMQVVDNFHYKYVPRLDSEVLSLPYGDGQYAMLVVLPSKQQSMKILMRDIKFMTFNQIVNMLEPMEVFVNLPRFEIDHTTDIASDLQTMGITEIFGPNANLSGIIQRGQIKVNNIVHKAKIEVNEKGTTAAGASAVIVIPLMGTSMPRFVADRPFLFFIYHVDSYNILFAGRLNYAKKAYEDIFSKPTNNARPQQQYVPNKPTKPPQQHVAPLSIDSANLQQKVSSFGLSSHNKPAVDPYRPQNPSQAPTNSQRKQQEQAIRQHANAQPSQPIYFNTDTVLQVHENAYSARYYASQNQRQLHSQ